MKCSVFLWIQESDDPRSDLDKTWIQYICDGTMLNGRIPRVSTIQYASVLAQNSQYGCRANM